MCVEWHLHDWTRQEEQPQGVYLVIEGGGKEALLAASKDSLNRKIMLKSPCKGW